jgi:hypothetical protein
MAFKDVLQESEEVGPPMGLHELQSKSFYNPAQSVIIEKAENKENMHKSYSTYREKSIPLRNSSEGSRGISAISNKLKKIGSSKILDQSGNQTVMILGDSTHSTNNSLA